MKRGFRLVLHKDIPEADRKLCLDYLQNDILPWFSSDDSYKCRAESGAFFRRGKLGLTLGEGDKYAFRRLVKNRRIFGIMPVDKLERKDGEPIEVRQCMCGIHRAGQMVNIVGGFNESDFEVIHEVGEIKG